jgi:uncharacterized damage-inducible protein DinB
VSKRIVLLQALAATMSDLVRMLANIDRAVFYRQLSLHGWSMADVLSHLIRVETRYYQRLRRVLVEERPYLPAILPDPPTHNRPASPTELLAQFEAARLETLAFLRDMAEAGWGRTAVHETLGEVTFYFLVQYLVDHDSQHLNQIAMIQQQLNAAPDRKAQPAIFEK